MQRTVEIQGWQRRERLAGDVSTRVYHRVVDADGATAVLVEYDPQNRRQMARDLEVLHVCRARGLPVPRVLAGDPGCGRAVVEDLGASDAEAVAAELPAAERSAFMGRLLEPLVSLARWSPVELPAWNPPLDEARLRWELTGFELWCISARTGAGPGAETTRWLDRLAAEVAAHPGRVCHRDYHLNNLLVRADGAIGVIDVQDILIGPDSYDVVSLLFERAATELLPAALRDELLAEWAESTAAAPGWRERASAVRLQRGLKVVGTFARLVAAGRRRYGEWLASLSAALVTPLIRSTAPDELIARVADTAAVDELRST